MARDYIICRGEKIVLLPPTAGSGCDSSWFREDTWAMVTHIKGAVVVVPSSATGKNGAFLSGDLR